MKFAESPLLSERLPASRARFVQRVLLAGFALLIGRSLWLQGIHNDFLQKKGESRYERTLEVSATRGRILDRHGDALAVSTPVTSIWAIPEDVKLTPHQARELAALLDLDVHELNRRLTSRRDFVYLKRQLPPDQADKVLALDIGGIHEQREYRRFYPTAEVNAHLLGFTGVEDKGQEGIELAFEEQLAGKPGWRRVIKDRRGRIVQDVEIGEPPRNGRDIMLSLDNKIQYLAFSALKQAVGTHRARAGSIVVLDVRSGEILALVNWPTFNPNNRVQLAGAQLRNRAFTDTFEPGSTFKPFAAALALETGKFRFDTPIQTAPGRLTIGNATISDVHPHGTLTVAQVIQKSSNVGASKLALSFPPEQMWQMFDSLGFGQPLRLGFPGEVGGRLRPAKSWRPIEQATMSYGHGISVTLIQLARAYLVFARDGDLLPLSLEKVRDGPIAGGKAVFSPQTAREVRAMLEMVVQPGGTATRAQIPGYRVAGKTGTAHKLESGVYANKYIASFVGLAPVSDPRLVIAVMIDEPSAGKHYGGEVAAPVFAQVMAGALRTLGVPPDAPLKPLQLANVPPAKEEM